MDTNDPTGYLWELKIIMAIAESTGIGAFDAFVGMGIGTVLMLALIAIGLEKLTNRVVDRLRGIERKIMGNNDHE